MMLFDKLKKDECGNVGIVMGLVTVAIGILILAIVLTIGPVVGYNVQNSITVPANTAWDTNTNTAILNGSEVWAQNTPLLGSAAIVVIASIIIGVLLGAFMLRRQQ